MIRLINLLKEISRPTPVVSRGNILKFKVSDIFPNPPIEVDDETYNQLMGDWEEANKTINQLPTKSINIGNLYPHQDLVDEKKVLDILKTGTRYDDMNDVFVATADNKTFYLVDGHTRVSAQILKGKTNIKARVFTPNN
jgi:hypothetical protein